MESGSRESAIQTLAAAYDNNIGSGSILALAKGYIYLAMDAAATKTRDPQKQVERNERVCQLLAQGATNACLGVQLFQSQLCAVSRA